MMHISIDSAIGASPGSTVDVDAIVATGRRRTRLRRFATIGSAAGTVAVVGVVTALALTTAAPPTSWRSGSAPPTLPQAARAESSVGAAPVRDGETPEQAQQRIVAALTDDLAAALPGVQLVDGPTGQPGIVLSDIPGTHSSYDAATIVTTAAGTGTLWFQSFPGDVPLSATPETVYLDGNGLGLSFLHQWFSSCADLPAASDVVRQCEQSVGPDGQSILTVSEQGQPMYYQVYVSWTNARVMVYISNCPKTVNPVCAAAPLLTMAQLTAIAIDPDLTVTS